MYDVIVITVLLCTNAKERALWWGCRVAVAVAVAVAAVVAVAAAVTVVAAARTMAVLLSLHFCCVCHNQTHSVSCKGLSSHCL